jgi:predicted metal-dependent peptidase
MRDPRLPSEYSEALSPALTVAMFASPFFGFMLMGTGVMIRHTTATRVKVAATDGYYIYLAERWRTDFKTKGQAFIVLHELVHVWFNHAGRCKHRNKEVWGQAIDAFTNTFVEAVCVGTKLTTPEGCVQPHPRYLKMTVEDIYDEFMEDAEEEAKSADKGDGDPSEGDPLDSGKGGGADDDEDDEGEGDPLAGDVDPSLKDDAEADGYSNEGRSPERDRQAVQTATAAAKEMLKAMPIPGPVGDLIGARIADVLAPRLDWGSKLRQDLVEAIGDDYEDWGQPNPYYPGVVVPTTHGAKTKRIDYFVDCSGSMTADWFNRVAAEVVPLLGKCEEFWLHTFDAVIRSSLQIQNPGELTNYKYDVGDHCSTHIEPILEFLSETQTMAIIGTDGYFQCPDINPGVNLRWVIPEEAMTTKPWGEVHVLPRERY